MMELATVQYGIKYAGKEGAYRRVPVPFTKPFKLDGKELNAANRESGKATAYVDFAELGEKVLWLNYSSTLYEALKDMKECHLAENEEGKYIALVLPKECRQETLRVHPPGSDFVYMRIIWAPVYVTENLRKRLDPAALFHYATAVESITEKEKAVIFGTYFQIFDDFWKAKVECPYCQTALEVEHNGLVNHKPMSPAKCPKCEAEVRRYVLDPESLDEKREKAAEAKGRGYIVFHEP
jgi:hypothetical protein